MNGSHWIVTWVGSTVAGLLCSTGLRAEPAVTAVTPRTLSAGTPAAVELSGKELTSELRAIAVETSTPIQIGNVEPTKATGSIDLPAGFVGPLGILPVTSAGPGAVQTVIVDDLPIVVEKDGNRTPATAQEIAIPACIDGMSQNGQADCFRFKAAAGQRLSIEVLTRQIGSPMDPVARLLDSGGKLVTTSDDSPAGAECRFSHTFSAAGDYTLELRHSAHVNASPYHLRIGDFPLVSHAMPLAVNRGGTTKVAFGGLDGAALPPVDVTVAADAVSRGTTAVAKLPGGRSSAWVGVLVDDAPQVTEAASATPLTSPVGISGRLDKPGERDNWRLTGTKDANLLLTTRGRSLGCGTVPWLRVFDAAGKLVAESPADADEPQFVLTFPADGEYRLEVQDLARRGGPDFGYYVSVAPAPGASLAVKPQANTRDSFAVEPMLGCAPIDVEVKRAGYDGEITLSLVGKPAGLRIVNPVIPEKAAEARIYVAADAGWTEKSLTPVRLEARATGAAAAQPAPAIPVMTVSLRRVRQPFVAFPPPAVDGLVFLAGAQGGKPRFMLAPPTPVQLSRKVASQVITLAVKRLDPAFTGPVAIGGQLLPKGFVVASICEKDLCQLTLTGSAVAGAEPSTLRLLAVSDIGLRTGIVEFDLPVNWTDAPPPRTAVPVQAMAQAPPAAAAGAASVPPPAFAASYAAAIEKLKPRFVSSLAEPNPAISPKGNVQLGKPGFGTFAGGRLEGVGPPLGPSWTASFWFFNLLRDDERPVTAYLFSRAPDGDVSGGDHFGIGGSYPDVKPGRLFLFNGNRKGEVLLGPTRLEARRWHHAVIVRDGGRVRVYLDGAAAPEIDTTFNPTGADSCGFFIGARADNFAPLQGNMAHLAMFDRALTAEEAASLATSAGVPGVGDKEAAPKPAAAAQPTSPRIKTVHESPTRKLKEMRPGLPSNHAVRATVAAAMSVALAAAVPAPAAEAAAAATPAAQPGTLQVYPPQIVLDGAKDRQQFAVTSSDAEGVSRDWTTTAKVTVAAPTIAAVVGTSIFPFGDGTTEAVIEAGGMKQTVPVTVKNAAMVRPTLFENDLMVALSKQSCSAGACHGSPSGKGGFRLSLRAFDKAFDEGTLLREEFGRRVNPLEPEASLLLLKPLMKVPHGGGKQVAIDDEAYAVIKTWIAEGAKADPPTTPRCVRLEVSPVGRQVQRLADGGRQIVATAHYADGTRRDVSHLVAYESSALSVATVDARGWVTPHKRGETVVLVRYLEHIELVPLMFVEQVAGFAWQAPPENNEIDRLVDAKLRDLQYPPSPLCTDSEFVRRVYLDVIGLLPTVEETQAFLADTASDKRAKLIDRLLERDEYARFWALKWGDLLRMTKKLAGDEGVHKYHRWLEDSFRRNKPHDQFARELLLGTGSSFDNPPANFYRTTAGMNETVETVSQLFLGVRLQCAKCHNHPFDRWSQDNYYGLGAFFERVKKRNTQVPGESFIYVAASGETKQPRTNQFVKPWLPRVGTVEIPAEADRREAFAEWLLDPKNPSFARVEANRIWSQLFARGIVHPVDEFRDSNPASNMPLLDALAKEFVESGFDRKRLLRTILDSRTYQASSKAVPLNKDDTLYFSHQLPRLLGAEQLLDGISQVTGVEHSFENLQAGIKATQLPAPDVARTDFLTTFGQPARGTVCACERTEDSSLAMAIELLNGKLLHGTLVDADNRFRKALAAGRPVEDVIGELYLAAVCRPPVVEELAAAMERVKAAKDPASGFEDVCWALLNSDEFVFQH